MTERSSQTGSGRIISQDNNQRLLEVANELKIENYEGTDMEKENKTNALVTELAYQTTKTNALKFLSGSSTPLQTKRAPMLEPSDLFTVKLKKTKPATSMIEVDSLRETTRKQIHFNKCANDISQIYPNLFISGDRMARSKEKLQEKNIRYVLNLAPSVCKNYFEQDFEYSTLNLIDSTSENDILWAFLKSIEIIEKSTPSQPCFVHCHQGVSRSGAIVVAYVMFKEKISFREAFEIVKAKHEVCSPNAAFIAQLIKFQNRLEEGSDTFQEEAFLLGRHSLRDNNIVLKSLEAEVNKGTLEERSGNLVEVLDSRGTFLFFKSSEQLDKYVVPFIRKHGSLSGMFFVYQGKDDSDKVEHRRAAMEYISLLQKYVPTYSSSQVAFIDSNARFIESDDYQFDFFELSKVPKRTISQHDFMDKYFVYAGEATKSVPKKVKLSASPKVSLLVKLYLCKISDGLHSFEHLNEYDSDDLASHSAYVMEVVNAKTALLKYYIWLGKDIETMINIPAATQLCKEYIVNELQTRVLEQLPHIRVDKLSIEKEGVESKDFMVSFQAGM